MHNLKTGLLICVAALLSVAEVYAADFMLSGVITARNGQKLEGVTVSAKLEGATITTSVYTDSGGSYVFPPLAAGRYRVWAQALGFETAKSPVVLASAQRSNFTLDEIRNAERRFRQLPGEMMVAALPEATPEDAHMKKIFMNNCTGCHATSYALQFRFDEAGWSKIIDLMKVVPVNGVYPGPNAKPSQILERNQKPLAAYLARARAGCLVDESGVAAASRRRSGARRVDALRPAAQSRRRHRHAVRGERRHRLDDGYDLQTWSVGA